MLYIQVSQALLLTPVLFAFRRRSYDHSEPFEQLCRRVEGVVVESRHPYPKVNRIWVSETLEAFIMGSCFFAVSWHSRCLCLAANLFWS